MCGILGHFSANPSQRNPDLFTKALDTLVHRGPDSGAVATNPFGFLGHRRLSIIDLSAEANQPFTLPDVPGLSMVFNGEIYNFKELRAGLPDCRTQADTEVIVRGYRKEGKSFFAKLRGIYAFAILDLRNEPELLLLRDPSGVKPLYTARFDGEFIFGSEMKAVRPLCRGRITAHESAIMAYLSVGYCLEPYTAYREISAQPPGVLTTVNLHTFSERSETIKSYSFRPTASGEDPLKRTDSLLRQAVSRNVVSDVPVFFSLSGGIDSSLILAYAARNGSSPRSITVSFSDRDYDESPVAREFLRVLGLEGMFVDSQSAGSLPLLNRLLDHFDQPFADSSLIPFYLLTQASSKFGKVLIGGDGGDEIHAGYFNFRVLPAIDRFRWVRPLLDVVSQAAKGDRARMVKKISQLMRTASQEELLFLKESWIYPDLTLDGQRPFLFSPSQSFEFYASCYPMSGSETLDEKITKDAFQRRMLGDYLRKADMMSMINSVEYRVPMLDEDLVDYSLSLSLEDKSGWMKGKRVLRSLHAQYYPEWSTNRPKTGFSIPLDTWLSKQDYVQIEETLRDSQYLKQYVNPRYTEGLFESLVDSRRATEVSRAGVYQQILIFYALHRWYDNTFGQS